MRPFFIGLSIALGFSINPLVMAQSADKNIQNKIRNFKFDKSEIADFIRSLRSQSKISAKDAEAALERLSAMTIEELQSLTMDSIGNVYEPASQSENLALNESNAQKKVIDKIMSKRSPASLSDMREIQVEEERERKRLEEAQAQMLKNGFDIKKFQ